MQYGAGRFGEGSVIGGRWRLVEPIGSGSMAQVWKAVRVAGQGCVAIKFLVPAVGARRGWDDEERDRDEAERRNRFRRESRVLKDLCHPGITAYYDDGEHGFVPYIVMEHVEGDSLRDFLKRHGSLSLPAAAALVVQLADALAYAHARGVVHRDLKPYNVMVAAQTGQVVLLDFGIAKLVDPSATRYTMDGSTLGSTGYQSPEQIVVGDITVRSDVYSLACIVYELIAGERPFTEEGEHALRDCHLKDRPLTFEERGLPVPAAISGLVARMLAKDEADRPDAVEVREAFRVLAPGPGDAAPRPVLSPDVTLPLRTGEARDDVARPAEGPAAGPSAGKTPAAAPWLDRRQVTALCARADREISERSPGDAVRALMAVADRVGAEWGTRSPLVIRVRKTAEQGADLMREAGDAIRSPDGGPTGSSGG
ncbi:serine/threonine-protein kinase [Streptomyces cremeus]|uniref:Protein kinase n=1 Tax=Streptomyces cremeus TaxID=66881 RepID=A0ABV5P5J5_STRCM